MTDIDTQLPRSSGRRWGVWWGLLQWHLYPTMCLPYQNLRYWSSEIASRQKEELIQVQDVRQCSIWHKADTLITNCNWHWLSVLETLFIDSKMVETYYIHAKLAWLQGHSVLFRCLCVFEFWCHFNWHTVHIITENNCNLLIKRISVWTFLFCYNVLQAKKMLIDGIDRFIQEKILLAAKAISEDACLKICDGDVILVYSRCLRLLLLLLATDCNLWHALNILWTTILGKRSMLHSPTIVTNPPSVTCLSAMLLHPTERVVLFGNISAPSNSSGTSAVCIEILGGKRRGSSWFCKLNGKAMKNWCF